MKHVLLYLLFCLPLAGLCQELSLTNLLLSVDTSLLINANDMVRNAEMRYTVKDESEGEEYYYSRVTLLNKKSNANRLVVFYDSESKITKLRATVYDKFGVEAKVYKLNDFEDYSAVSGYSIYEDNRVKVLNILSSSYPYTIEFEYTRKQKGIGHVMFPSWTAQGYNQSVEKASFIVDVPVGFPFNFKQFNLEQKPQIKEADGHKQYQWQVADLPAVVKEDNGPVKLDILPAVYTSPERFKTEGYTGSMATWQDYGKFIYQLHADRDALPDDLAAKVKDITAGLSTDREKIVALYRFMQQNTRYVSVQLGIGGWQPFSSEYVYQNGYGDCKALSNYMHAMLKQVGISSYPTLIFNGEPPYEIDEAFTRPNFNHEILYVPSEDMWLECTSSFNPPNYLGKGNADHPVLLITPEGGQLARTPALSVDENLENHLVQINLSEDGQATVTFAGTYAGGDHEWCRWAEFAANSKDREDLLREQTALPNFNIISLDIKNSITEPTAAVNYSVEVPRYAARAGKRMFVPINPINPRDYVPAVVDNRRYPIRIRYGFTELTRIEFQLPKDFKLEGLPIKEEEVTSSFGSYTVSTRMEGDKLVYTRRFRIEPTSLPASEYEQYRDFYLQVAKLDGAKMVLVQERT